MRIDELAEILEIPNLPAYIGQVDKTLLKSLPTNSVFREPLSSVIKRGGKRLRPALVISTMESSGKKVDKNVISAAAAVELVHLASLLHDDILDEATVRGGKATINEQDGIGIAILAGDYLLSKAFGLAAAVNKEVAVCLADAIAIMADGQAEQVGEHMDVEALGKGYIDIARKKTASLFGSACRIGAVCSGLSISDIDLLGDYGESFGIAFQIIDDVIDGEIPSSLCGKAIEAAKQQNAEAIASLTGLPDKFAIHGLANLPDNYIEIALQNSGLKLL